MSVRILLACCRRQLCAIKGGGGCSLCRSAALLSVVLSCLSCLRCGPALLVRASEASQSCVRQHATVSGPSSRGGGWWRRTTPSGFGCGVCASEASTEHGRDDTQTKKEYILELKK